jgi:hypothetical protein
VCAVEKKEGTLVRVDATQTQHAGEGVEELKEQKVAAMTI